MSASHERSVQASRQSDRRDDERKADLARHEMAQKEQDRRVSDSARQADETRFFAIEDRKEAPVDSRQQVRSMRERVRQTYVEQENRAARDAIHEQRAHAAQAEQRAQHNDAQQPIDLIA
ncbi:MAG TPA: hypothetical protein ENI98_12265 [Gammaproteobacteria bacterium]|nr:hypothetical protein [Gammaproteobacteria bacterium]